ncbi:MAG: glycosyltransferase family 2 protein [Candidatus Saganbacteria bacterium]|nr:glycosyltransferase family 2 protein [Candidatus Saganbacteria bacterium]
MNQPNIDLSIVMPCLNEEATIAACIRSAKEGIKTTGLTGEIVVVDNGSNDKSVEIAKSLGAKVVYEPQKGYGNAYKKGFEEACGKYLIMGDSDNTYDFSKLKPFIDKLKKGADVVMGSRLKGKVMPGAMPILHQYFGTPFLAALLNLFFRTGISDPNCGMRGLTKDAFNKMKLQSGGMEFASEMIDNARRERLQIVEVPINYYPREGESKLRTFHDGWRHLRFMLVNSPTYLFIVPGIILLVIGLFLLLTILPGPFRFGKFSLDIHFMVLGSALAILGTQIISIGLFAKCYAYIEGAGFPDDFITAFTKYFSLERGIYTGGIIFLIGFIINLYILIKWLGAGMGALAEVRTSLFALTLVIIGLQIVFSSFFISILLLKKGKE